MGTSSSPPPPPPPPPSSTLIEPSSKKRHKPVKVLRAFRNVFRSFPIITPVCKLPSLPGGRLPDGGATRVTGTIFGHRKGRAALSLQENPRTLPMMVVELAMHTHALQKELSGGGMLRIALECEKQPVKDKSNLMDEPVWTVFANGKKSGYGRRREATEDDLHVMEVLKAMSMGTGVVPPQTEAEGGDGEMVYMRWQFERVVGSKDSETLYMISPNGGSNGPDLSIFFVRI